MSSFPNFSNIADYVVKEINRRKSDTKVISELNCWTRVISGVDAGLVLVSNPNIALFKAAGQNIDSLYGSSQTSGTIGKNWAGNAVNTGPDPQVGLPSPIISSFEVDEGSGAISRKASFTVTAYTRKQLDEVTKYFLEPGFTVFLEWGWNTGIGVKPLAKSPNKVTVEYVTKAASATQLNEARKTSGGHYECYLGFITGGDISFSDGKWDVSVKLTGFTELPSYLNASDNSTNNQCDEKVKTEEFVAIENTKILGEKRFKQVFNALPTPRRTNLVKGLINDVDVSHVVNFINFEEEIRKQIADNSTNALQSLVAFFGGDVGNTKAQGVTIPNGSDIIGSERFIRFGTLMKIINTNGMVSVKLGDNDIQMYIDTKNTPISAFDRIFSTDKSKLIIPNQNTPKFSIQDAIEGELGTSDESSDCSIVSKDKTIKFPYRKDIENGKVDAIKLFYDGDASYVKINKKGTDWGFLDDLYINFDFAASVLDTPKLSLKDVLYELLNGMSSAVNGLWNFQIQESSQPDDKGLTYLRVVDMNFISEVPITKKDNDESTLEFQLYGAKSVFIDSTFTSDIGGSMMNKIIGERLSATINPSDQPTGGRLFSSATDQVLKSLEIECPPTNIKDATPPSNKETEDLVRRNLEKFVERVGVYPKVELTSKGWFDSVIDDILESTDIEENTLFISYDDKNLFNEYKLIDTGQTADSENSTITENDVSILLPITFSFTIHGISGIKRGDMFTVNGLPDRYGEDRGFFQVISVKHVVQNMSWKTTVEGGFRNRRKKKDNNGN